MAVIFPDVNLKIFDYNRVVKDLNGNTSEEFINKIKDVGFYVFPFRPFSGVITDNPFL